MHRPNADKMHLQTMCKVLLRYAEIVHVLTENILNIKIFPIFVKEYWLRWLAIHGRISGIKYRDIV